MRLLPCLRFDSDRWWLPRSARTTELLMFILLRSGDPLTADASLIAKTVDQFQQDPPLLIYAGLSYRGSQNRPVEISVSQLATWFCTNAAGLFAEGDAFLGSPKLDQSHLDQFRELDSYFRTLRCERWLEAASLWLEATGKAVPPKWSAQWPVITFDSNTQHRPSIESCSDSLQQLARKMQHLQSLERSFDRRLHKSKLAALKQLTYGLSHEINNPLANISTRAQQLQQQEDDPSKQQTLSRIVDQVYRAHEMIADLMFYANPPKTNLERFDVSALVFSVSAEFSEEIDRLSIRLETDIPPDATTLLIDPEMIGEAIRVLIRNAIEAIGSDGTIVVSLVRETNCTLIHVADSGPGLSRLAREHAFDPYFSGREAGRGLGLGLCRAYRIAKLHHAEITLAGGPIGCVATIRLT
ncbi:Sensor protein ZraS [Novipirellula aureliae]|uniref:histidine kinase n=1 Tax=Novipirellula aureliae TaxID=2527966 RepID=A0A5C6E2Y2_9BACT|nr:histidine kinase dimerization/phospho-acceptor domain-containing protein [Novipirellula aureliae]TWU43218.1 Sensor protein ZraS [Novipirellula aureliae]